MTKFFADAESFSKWTSGIQACVASIGIIVAGTWVVFTFWSLRATSKARAEIADLEQRAVEQPILSIELKPMVLEEVKGQRFISVAATLRNDGKRAVQFESAMLLTTKLGTKAGEMTSDGPVTRTEARFLSEDGTLAASPARLLRAGQARTIAFYVSVAPGATYLVQLHTIYSGLSLDKGDFVPSSDVPIEAFEQAIIDVRVAQPRPKPNDSP
jgi:hypothetical protein